jgi:hypothetical protein
MSDQTENQTQLDFTAEIGTLDYSSVRLNDFHVEGRRLSTKEDFLNRIQSEDPLEGTSWHFQNVSTPTRRRRITSKSLHSCQSTKKVVTLKLVCNKLQILFIFLFIHFCSGFLSQELANCQCIMYRGMAMAENPLAMSDFRNFPPKHCCNLVSTSK